MPPPERPEPKTACSPKHAAAAVEEDCECGVSDTKASPNGDEPTAVPNSELDQDSSILKVPQKRPRATRASKRITKKQKHQKKAALPPAHLGRSNPPKGVWPNIQESPIAKVQDSFSRKNRRKLLDLSLNTPVTIKGYNKSSAAKRRPRMSSEYTNMFGHFLDRFQAPKLKAPRRKQQRQTASRRRAGMRHSRRSRR